MKNYGNLIEGIFGINNDYFLLMHLIDCEYGYFALKMKINTKYQRQEMIEEILTILSKMKYNLIHTQYKKAPLLGEIFEGDPRDGGKAELDLIDELYQKWLDEEDA